ncbi:hypothetical protein GCM10022630_20060 [Thermobifida alba]
MNRRVSGLSGMGADLPSRDIQTITAQPGRSLGDVVRGKRHDRHPAQRVVS